MTEHRCTPHTLIIGGTSGIGLALARYYLAQNQKVTILGHNQTKLNKLAIEFMHHPNIKIIDCDISDNSALDSLLIDLTHTFFHRLIYSAGIYTNERQNKLDQSQSNNMLAINLKAFQRIFIWASEKLIYWQSHYPNLEYQLVCLSSVAGLLNFKGNSLYATCKRSMIHSAESYRQALSAYGISVVCIASGYVDTEQLRFLNKGDASHKPFLVSESKAVEEIIYACNQNIGLYVFPKPMKYLVQALSLLPSPLLGQLMKLQYRKQDHRLN